MAHVQFETSHPFPTTTGAWQHSTIPRQTTGRNFGRISSYDEYLKILNEGTEPLD